MYYRVVSYNDWFRPQHWSKQNHVSWHRMRLLYCLLFNGKPSDNHSDCQSIYMTRVWENLNVFKTNILRKYLDPINKFLNTNAFLSFRKSGQGSHQTQLLVRKAGRSAVQSQPWCCSKGQRWRIQSDQFWFPWFALALQSNCTSGIDTASYNPLLWRSPLGGNHVLWYTRLHIPCKSRALE